MSSSRLKNIGKKTIGRSKEEAIKQLLILKAELAKTSLYQYVKFVWSLVDPTEYSDDWHIECICEHLQAQFEGEKELRKMIINIAPRHTKSMLCSITAPTWYWIHKPQLKIMSISSNQSLAMDFVTKSRLILESDLYTNLLAPENFALDKAENTKRSYRNVFLGERKAFGFKNRIAGYGFDHLIMDDPNDLKDWAGKDYIAVNETYSKAVKNRQNNPSKSTFLVVQQRLPYGNDLTNYLEEHESGDWFKLVLPTEYKQHFTFKSPININDPRNENEILVKNRFSLDYFNSEKKDPVKWSAMYQQNPQKDGGNIVKRQWICYYQHQPQYFETQFLSIDTAIEMGIRADHTVALRAGLLNSKVYVLEIFRDKLSFPDFLTWLRDYEARYPDISQILVENRTYGSVLIQILQSNFSKIVPIDTGTKTKLHRLYSALPMIMDKKLYLPDPTLEVENLDILEEELYGFPGHPHDDIVDTITQLLNHLKLELNYDSSTVVLANKHKQHNNPFLSDTETLVEAASLSRKMFN